MSEGFPPSVHVPPEHAHLIDAYLDASRRQVTALLALLAAHGGQADELVPLDSSPLEVATARALVQSGRLQASRLGRRWYTSRRALLALLDKPAGHAAVPADDAYADLVARKRRAR